MIWSMPTTSGDYRLRAVEDHCELEIESPTAAEITILHRFLKEAVSSGWIVGEQAFIRPTGVTTLSLAAPLQAAGKLLLQERFPAETVLWTALRSAEGAISLQNGAGNWDALVPPVVAATIKPPQRGCPRPEAAARRGSEVLRAFSTVDQWARWEAEGLMRVVGSFSGRTYTLFHRDEAARRGHDRVLLDARGRAICVWDGSVPAEEEALGIKLAVEHREMWLRF